jgi:phage-related protein
MDIMVALLPALDSLATMLTVVVSAFNALPEPLRNLVVLASVLAVAWGPITGLLTALAGLKIGATIAGWAGVIGPAIAAITAAFSGLLAYLTGTMLPALLAFFSGPVGWTVLAVAAVVAMAIAFREPIGEFLSWLGGALQDGLKAGLKIAYDIWVKPWVDIWDNVLRKPISDLLSWMGNAIRAPFEAAANFVKGIIRGILQTIANGINAAVGAINRLIGAYNSLPTPDLPLVPTIAIPQFAQGGVVNRPTLAMVGEGGEREYIIPESKMAAASARYLSGGRGDAVLSGGAGNSIINIRTGPVMSAQGQQWVTMADLERAVRQTEAGVMARIRTPAGRRALGIR